MQTVKKDKNREGAFNNVPPKKATVKKPNLNGLRFSIWLNFMMFSLILLAVMWLFQFVFAKTYYNSMRINDVRKLSESAVTSLRLNVWDSSVEGDLERLARTNGFNIYLFNQLNQCYYGFDANGNKDKTVSGVPNFNLSNLKAELIESGDGIVCDTVKDDSSSEKVAIRYAMFFVKEGTTYIYFTYVPLFGMESTMTIMTVQLLIITGLALALSFLAASLMSYQLSKPIEEMSRSAVKLASGDYDARFVGNGYTEIDDLSDSLNYATRELAKAENLRKDIIANVSHDLRTPLTLIKSYAEMVRDLSGDNKEKREKHLNTIISESDRLSDLVNDILKLSKNEKSDTLIISEYNISEQLNEIVNIYREGNKNRFTFECDIDDNLIIKADKQKIYQVFDNFLSNAVKYSGKSTIIRLVLKEYDQTIRFDIFDYGIGISKEELPHVWDRYTKASLKHQRDDSHGLGLSIVKTILVKHGANYGANSKIGEGSNFYFELPLL